jgi:hypothetical protein
MPRKHLPKPALKPELGAPSSPPVLTGPLPLSGPAAASSMADLPQATPTPSEPTWESLGRRLCCFQSPPSRPTATSSVTDLPPAIPTLSEQEWENLLRSIFQPKSPPPLTPPVEAATRIVFPSALTAQIQLGRFAPCLTLGDVASMLGLSVRSVQRLIAAGRLRKLSLNGAARIAPSELARFLEGGPLPPAQEDSNHIK